MESFFLMKSFFFASLFLSFYACLFSLQRLIYVNLCVCVSSTLHLLPTSVVIAQLFAIWQRYGRKQKIFHIVYFQISSIYKDIKFKACRIFDSCVHLNKTRMVFMVLKLIFVCRHFVFVFNNLRPCVIISTMIKLHRPCIDR